MKKFAQAIGMGFLAWLIPFVIAFTVFPFRQTNRPLFESIMAVAVAATAVGLGLVYLKRMAVPTFKNGLYIGPLWWVVCIVIDLPLVSAGPMEMSLGMYMADIGLTYAIFPLVTTGLGIAFSSESKSKELA